MVTAKRGKSTITVSNDAFEKIFKPKGYKVVGITDNTSKNDFSFDKEPLLDNNRSEIDSIPISEMNNEQLKEYARLHNIDISKTKSAAEARKAIRAYLRKSEM